MWTALHHGASVRVLAQGRARGGLSWVSQQITLCEWDVSSCWNAAPPTPPRRICVFDVRKAWTSGVGAKGNRNLSLTFCASAAWCYVQKLGREKKATSFRVAEWLVKNSTEISTTDRRGEELVGKVWNEGVWIKVRKVQCLLSVEPRSNSLRLLICAKFSPDSEAERLSLPREASSPGFSSSF